jgi:hypothetical protein
MIIEKQNVTVKNLNLPYKKFKPSRSVIIMMDLPKDDKGIDIK